MVSPSIRSVPAPQQPSQSARPRRRPRYLAFLLTGALIGLVAAVVLILGPARNVADPPRLFAYLAAMLAGLGALAGGVVAVVAEGRRST